VLRVPMQSTGTTKDDELRVHVFLDEVQYLSFLRRVERCNSGLVQV
jgi:hypothetical protein